MLDSEFERTNGIEIDTQLGIFFTDVFIASELG